MNDRAAVKSRVRQHGSWLRVWADSPWAGLSALSLGFFLVVLDTTIVGVATPIIMADFRSGVTVVMWVTTGYLLSYTILLLLSARLGDRYGARGVYVAGLAVFSLASLSGGLSVDITMLISSRVVQGIGAGLVVPQTMAIITRTFPAERRDTAIGIWGGVAGLAFMVGPVVGGLCVDLATWRWIFYLNVPLGAFAVLAALVLVKPQARSVAGIDLTGLVLSGIAIAAMALGLQEGAAFGWGAQIWLLLGIAALFTLSFISHQRWFARDPVVPSRLFRDKKFTLGTIASAGFSASVTAQMFPIYLYLQVALGMPAIRSALIIAPLAVMLAAVSPLVGKINKLVPLRYIVVAGFAIDGIGLLWLALLLSGNVSNGLLLLISAILGIASGLIWAPVTACALSRVPIDDAGSASGVHNALRQLGGVLGSAAGSAAVASRAAAHGLHISGTHTLPAAISSGPLRLGLASALAESLLLPVAILVCCAVVAWFGCADSETGIS